MNKARSNNIKHQLLMRHKMTLKAFAEKYGFKYQNVSDVSRGLRAGNYGIGREITEKLVELIGPLDPEEPGERQAA